ncbi:MAG TPA: nuclear transport factor 2 family protein [Thermoanaerobaculaceae bacterium]|nr:nuclear transport factor 2 family protein [Thermoanaerobaculaceae bacterium]HPS79085.1 nuclear transport factor 2 family protein [Thermoanaerobaculaceae bacterium]
MIRLGAVLAAGLLVAGAPSVAAVDIEAEKAVIARVVDDNIGWFATKNFDLMFSTMADDPDLFYFSPDSQGTIHGIEAVRKLSAIWRDPGARYLNHEIRDLRIHVHPSGEVAWYSAILDDCGEYSGQKGCWKDTRWTGVLEKRQGRWVIMQMHFSFASDHVRDRVEKRLREELTKASPSPVPTP